MQGANVAAAEPHRSTMLELVQSLGHESRSEAQVVATAARLINSGRVVLTGNFAGSRIDPRLEAPAGISPESA